MESENRIEGIYNLTLERNNSHVRKLNFVEDSHVFFMLDYFNFLHVKKLEDDKDGYKMLCGINNSEDMAAARKIMGIYALVQDGKAVKNLFQCSGQKLEETSKAPFVGIVQINIIDYEQDGQEKIELGDIQNQLLKYREKIEESLKRNLGSDGEFQVFQTITSEDFCAVIRTSKMCRVYEAVTGLMEIKNNSGKRIFFTYTNVGIECIREREEEKGIKFLRLNESIVEENAHTPFVIRFRMENCVLKEIQQLMNNNGRDYKLEAVNGLFGRYDLVARICIEEFQEIYPYLCQNKAGYLIKIDDYGEFRSPFVKQLVKGMEKGTIKTLNVRALMDLNEVAGQGASGVQPWLDDEKAGKIESRSEKVWQHFKDFQKAYGKRFVFNRYRYLDLCNMLERLMSSYKNLAYELDTHTNWFICNQYLEIFFENMNYYMENVHEDDDKAKEKFLNEFQAFINAFGEFVRILQDNNQHTIQAPRYDLVTPIDGQKFLLAYGEYMDHMHEEYCSMNWAVSDGSLICKEDRKKARVIIYPDVSRNNIEMMEVIQYDSGSKKEGSEKVSSLLLCKIPMFEYFERTYDLLPLISHEICHSMLVLRRDIRNKFLITMLFREISKIISYNIEEKACRGKYVVEYDSITELLSECLAEALQEDYQKKDGDKWENLVLKHITISVYEYMQKLMEEEEGGKRLGIGNIPWDKIEKHFYDIAKEIYAEDEEFLSAISKSEASKKDGGAKHDRAVREVYELLLEKINELLPEKEMIIKKENLKDKTYIELDDFLVDWHKNYIKKCKPDVPQKQEVKRYVSLIKRLQVVYHDALCWENRIDSERLDSVLNDFSARVERKFREEFFNGDKFCIYSLDQMERVAYWELLKPERAKWNYQEALAEISLNEINRAIEHTITLYRESCADIVMCKWLGFDSFGYFRMAVTFSERMTDYREEISETGLFRRRLTAVLAVLLKKEKAKEEEVHKGVKGFSADKLWKKAEEYIQAEVIHARKRTLERINKDYADVQGQRNRAEEIHKKFFKILEAQMEAVKTRVSKGKAPQWKGALWDDMFKDDGGFFGEEDQDLRIIFQKEINLYRRVFLVMDAYCQIQRNGQLQVETEMLEHLTQIYDGIEKTEVHPVVKNVVNFYNNPMSEALTNFKKMEGMLRFIQDYYYYNRFRKMREEEL